MPHQNKTKSRKHDSPEVIGKMSVNSRGIGYVKAEGFEEDIEISANDLNTALHNDEVKVVALPKRKGQRQRGEVVEVIRRSKTVFVGTAEKEHGVTFLAPDDRRMYAQIIVTDESAYDLKPNTKIAVELVRWDNPKKNPEGKIIEVLGPAGEHETELRSIVRSQGFDWNYPPEVEEEAERIGRDRESFFASAIPSRRDFRDTPTFTIDPADAKDFDDAISVKELPDGKIELGVHIADVSAYVHKDAAIDREAQRRGTSIYLVDRTIPMLPEVLSNDLCSLRPNEDRLAFSAVFTIDREGHVHERWFGETVINSDKRFSYREAQDILDAGSGILFNELSISNVIAEALRVQRFKEGSIAFETDEVKFRLDDRGKPVEVFIKERIPTNLLIEDLMLLANREIATYVSDKNKKENRYVFVYRVHDAPNPEKIEGLSIFIKALGYELEQEDGLVSAKALNKLFKDVEGTPEQDLIETAAIRSMAKAVYSTKNIGHFGLAFKHYTHFTSPIRRYPDLMVHRLIKSHLAGTPATSRETAYYERLALQSTEREIAAVEAERDSIKFKQVEYMKEHIGEEFDGIITGITEWGVFVSEVQTKAEGMVRIRDMRDDYYNLSDRGYGLKGEKTGKKYRLGDKVKVKLTGADLELKTIDWVFI